MATDHREKILFPLTSDADGYPGVDWESMWAEPLGNGLFKLDNIPLYVRGISCEDVVKARKTKAGEWIFTRLKSPSAHSTLRVLAARVRDVVSIRRKLMRLGAECEGSNMRKLFAVHVPAEASLSKVRDYLNKAEAAGLLDYEESAIRHE